MSGTVIDAGEVLDARDRERGAARDEEAEDSVPGARGPAALTGARRRWPVGGRSLLVITGLVVAAIVTVLLMRARSLHQDAETKREKVAGAERVEKRAPPLKLAALAPTRAARPGPPAVTGQVEGAGGGRTGDATASDADPVMQRRLARGFGAPEGEGAGAGGVPGAASELTASSPQPGPAPLTSSAKPGSLEEKLEATELRAAAAGVLPDRDYLLTQGAMLDCVLETKIVSTTAGMTSCHLTRDVYSTNGRVVLLDRGSRVVGRYQGGLQHGEARIFVLWTRVETPSGVVVELQSPGTGPLGEAGLGGWVDTHFWDRFGSAILLSIVEDGADAAAARMAGANQGGGTNVNLTGTVNASKDVVAKSLEPTINIPPTLYKNQGERVGIFVARDLDFRSVYGLEPRARAR